VRLSAEDSLRVSVPNRDGDFAPEEGQIVYVSWPPHLGLVYAEDDGKVRENGSTG
jgi:hypothetical protein